MASKKGSAKSCRVSAYTTIRDRIMSGQLLPSGRVSDFKLARELKTSRTPVREAIKQLHGEGLLEPRKGGGYIVKRPSVEDFAELLQIRRLLECFAVEQAASRLTDEQIDQLAEYCKVFRDTARAVRAAKLTVLDGELACRVELADASFHLLILRAAGNRRILKVVSDLQIMTQYFGHRRYTPEWSLTTNLGIEYLQHARVARALRKRDAVQAKRMMESMFDSGEYVMKKHAKFLEHQHGGKSPPVPDWPAELSRRIHGLEMESEGYTRR